MGDCSRAPSGGNVRGEPIVCTPEEAFRCFMSTEIDRLVMGNRVLRKARQNLELADDYRNKYELD
jgi:carbamoyltransferase